MMPHIKGEITIGNILSIGVSSVALLSILVGLTVSNTNMRADIDQHGRDIIQLKLQVARQTEINEQNAAAFAEIKTDVKYMRESLSRLEARIPPNQR